jgi:hypothetical protein
MGSRIRELIFLNQGDGLLRPARFMLTSPEGSQL